MIPTKLSLKNFMCYRDNSPSLVLEGIHVACISGDNGHGKSTLLDAITWALWGKCRAKGNDELVHLGSSDMEVELEFIVHMERYRVLRKHSKGRGSKSGNTILELHAAVDSNPSQFRAITANTVRQTQRKLIDLLRMDYDTFVNSAYLRQGRADEFTTQTPTKRKEVLAEILGLAFYDQLEAQSRENARRWDQETSVLEREISQIDAQLADKPYLQAECIEAQEQLTEADQKEKDQNERIQALTLRKDLLEIKRQERARLQRDSMEARNDLKQLNQEIEDYSPRCQQYEKVLEQKQLVLEGYESLQQALAAKESLDRKLSQMNALGERRRCLESKLADERSKLNAMIVEKRTRIASLQEKADKVEHKEEELIEASGKLAQLDELEAELHHKQEELQEKSATVFKFRAHNEQLKQEMQELKERIDLIAQGDATCPLCGTQLGEAGLNHIRNAYEKQGLEKKRAYLTNQKLAAELTNEQAVLRQHLHHEEQNIKAQRNDLQGKTFLLENQIKEGKEALSLLVGLKQELSQLERQLDSGVYAAQLLEELHQLTTKIQSLQYDSDEHTRVQQAVARLKPYEEQYQELKKAEELLPELLQTVKRARERRDRLTKKLGEDAQREHSLNRELVELPQLEEELYKAKLIYQELQEQHGEWQRKLASVRAALENVERQERERAEKSQALKSAAVEKGIYEELAHAFGKGGVQALIIETALPEIEEEANSLLGTMTDNRMHVKIETQREKKTGGALETLDINISDELGTRPYELYSGGEAFRINFALRIALSKLLARRAGAPLPILFIDEGFGTQDSIGREKLLETINSIQDNFERIIVITHLEELKEAFPARIQVTKTAEGSTFSLV